MTLEYALELEEVEQYYQHQIYKSVSKFAALKQFFIYVGIAVFLVLQNLFLCFFTEDITTSFFWAMLGLPFLIMIAGCIRAMDYKNIVFDQLMKGVKWEYKNTWPVPVRLILKEGGLIHEREGISTFAPTDAITSLDIDDNLIYVMTKAKVCYIIPDRVFQDTEQKEQFTQRIQGWLDENKESSQNDLPKDPNMS